MKEKLLYIILQHAVVFANGGSTCYIVSVGSYEDALNKNAMLTGLEKLTLEQEITLVVIPEAVNLNSNEEFRDIQQQMLSHCGDRMKNRFALLDIYPKADENTNIEDQVTIFVLISVPIFVLWRSLFPLVEYFGSGRSGLDGRCVCMD